MNIKEMSAELIEIKLDEITEEIARIKAQIGIAKALAKETGQYADPVWYQRAMLAIRLKGKDHQALQIEFGKRRKEVSRAHNAAVERQFVEVARTVLAEHTFKRIMAEALQNAEAVP